jgi:hypothetical protein
MFKRCVVMLALMGLSGCGGSGGDSGPVTCSGDIRSLWVQLDIDFELDLRDLALGERVTIQATGPNNHACELSGQINGSACSGQLSVTESTYTGTAGSPIDCQIFEGTTNYQVSPAGNSMEVCETFDADDCVTYFRPQGGE